MLSLHDKITQDLQGALPEVIGGAITETIQEIFSQNLEVISPDQRDMATGQQIIVCAPLVQITEKFIVRLAFDKHFLQFLMTDYFEDDGDMTEACEDTASELANIISNKIKAFLNGNGLSVLMELPYIEHTDHSSFTFTDDEKTITFYLKMPVDVEVALTQAIHVDAGMARSF